MFGDNSNMWPDLREILARVRSPLQLSFLGVALVGAVFVALLQSGVLVEAEGPSWNLLVIIVCIATALGGCAFVAGIVLYIFQNKLPAPPQAPNEGMAFDPAPVWGSDRSPLAGTASLSLRPGMNLVSFPTAQTHSSTDALFSPAPEVDLVVTYDPFDATGPWLISARDTSGSFEGTLNRVETGKGYWVRCSAFTSIPLDPLPRQNSPIQMVKGWNLIGFISTGPDESVPLGSYFESLGSTWKVLFRYDEEHGWEKAKPNGLGFKTIDSGRGYWIWIDEDCTLNPWL